MPATQMAKQWEGMVHKLVEVLEQEHCPEDFHTGRFGRDGADSAETGLIQPKRG